jgi:hypothetical protein
MLPGTHSNLIVQQVSQIAHDPRGHSAAVQATMHMPRNAALLELADRFVGTLSEEIAKSLGLESPARRVLITAKSQRHAIARRAVSSQKDAELVAHRIAEAFANVRYILLPQKDPRVFPLVGHAASSDRWLLIPLKFVPSQSPDVQSDELWIRTAHPFGREKMRKARAKGLLRDLLPENAF